MSFGYIIHECYQSLFNRNKRMQELIKLYGKRRVRVFAISGQQMHPMYVKDYERELTPEEKGFGNTLYRTYFAKIYVVEVSH